VERSVSDEAVLSDQILHTNDFRLSYGECDPAGIVYYAAYYPWFERTFNEWNFLNDFQPAKLAEMWGATYVSRASGCEYLIPGRLFDPFTCEMRLGHVGGSSYSMRFDIVHRDSGDCYARGQLTLVFVDDTFPPKPVAVPELFKQELRARGVLG
jgi:YbgC/YbaW family acyl-CoA thioester hydrolase